MKAPSSRSSRRMRGFEQAAIFVREPVRGVGEKRGFAVTRLLTHWSEIVGEDLARITRPVKIAYARDGMGATLTLLASGAQAPMVQMQLPRIREKVNACYGYNAVSRINVTQTAPSGFADPSTVAPAPAPPDPEVTRQATETTSGVQDPGLRSALEALCQNILSRPQRQKGK